ncbi:MAG: hypothetical protein ABIQ59_04460 [Nocardioidaceae bacterium]
MATQVKTSAPHPTYGSSLWQQEALARTDELASLLEWFTAEDHSRPKEPHDRQALADVVQRYTHESYAILAAPRFPLSRMRAWFSGATMQRVQASLDAAEVTLLRLAPLDYLRSNMPVFVAEATDVLPPDDLRLLRLVALVDDSDEEGLTEQQRNTVVAAISAAKKSTLRAQTRTRSFRNVVLAATGIASALVLGVALVGIFAPDTLPLCYTPDPGYQVCPASGNPRPADSLLIEFCGILGAAISAVFALRKVQGSADPYSVSMALAVLKLPTGALTAFLGLLLISAGFVPGLSALDSSAQILSWAVVLGYSQELFTHLVDQQGQTVLADASFQGGRPMPSPPRSS